jgi:tetratricopeptide (TPR) repeat protein
MKKGLVTVVVAALTALFATLVVDIGWRFLFKEYTWGAVVRLYSWPEKSHHPIGYDPPNLLALQRQLLDGRYDDLDAHFARLQQDYLAGARPELEYMLSYIAFQTTNQEIGAALDRWVATRPDSAAALVARANFSSHMAWRTGEYAQPRLEPSENAKWNPDVRLYVAARRDLEKAVSLDPRNTVTYAELIRVGRRLDEERLGHIMRERGLAVDSLSYAVHLAWVTALLGGPNPERDAQEYVDSIRSEFTRNPLLKRLDTMVLAHRAQVLAREDEIHEAIDLLFEAGAIAESAYILSTRAGLLRKVGSREWAEADLDRAHDYLPHLVRTLAERAELHAESGRAELAARDFALALELDPLNSRTLWKRIRAHYGWRRYHEAEADLTTAMRLRPDDSRLRFQRGHIRLKKLDDAAGAAEDLAVVTEGYPDSPNVWQLYARALTEIDDCRTVEALAEYRRACEVTESDECRGSILRAETRRVEKMSERLACAPSG